MSQAQGNELPPVDRKKEAADTERRLRAVLVNTTKESPLTKLKALSYGPKEMVSRILMEMVGRREIATCTILKSSIRHDHYWMIKK